MQVSARDQQGNNKRTRGVWRWHGWWSRRGGARGFGGDSGSGAAGDGRGGDVHSNRGGIPAECRRPEAGMDLGFRPQGSGSSGRD